MSETENDTVTSSVTSSAHYQLGTTVSDNDSKPDKPGASISSQVRPGVRRLLKTWTDMSHVNYMSNKALDVITSSNVFKRRSIGLPLKEPSIDVFNAYENIKEEEIFVEQLPTNVTSLMNEDNLWGGFYVFPELYTDVYSPVVRIRELENVPKLKEGILTRDMVTACLSYLKRTPILGDYVYIKLNLASKQLINIDVLKHYKYLVYLDLSSNLLQELTVLSYLPYLQYISVAYNSLNTILDYETAQWFLTEVHYKFNSVKKINDLSAFWSITILDLSHNNIKHISGLEQLMYLRRLDLSFNHIQRLENLNNLRLLWLDVSYNNISTFEWGNNVGLWTLLHLEYLNLNENNLTSMKMFTDCTRLRELHVKNNRFFFLLELAVYMKQMRRLVVLDLRENPLCSTPGYKDVVVNSFPLLLSLDSTELDPVEQRSLKMDMFPDITAHATRRLLRLLYIEQLSRAKVSSFVPPADTTDVPIVVIVGCEAVGKGRLVRRLVSECSSNLELARQHTTAVHHYSNHFIETTRQKFDEMLLAGDLLTYSELNGESYGLSIYSFSNTLACREEAWVKNGKVKIVNMDLVGALMLKLRGYRPYLILATMQDTRQLEKKQFTRRTYRENYRNMQRSSIEEPFEHSALQVLLSGRIIITGILNEIIMDIPEEKEQSEFQLEPECSLMMDSQARKTINNGHTNDPNLIDLLTSSNLSISEINKKYRDRVSHDEKSLYSLYKESQTMTEYASYTGNGQESIHKTQRLPKVRYSNASEHNTSTDFGKYTSTRKGSATTRSSKSVTFTSHDNNNVLDPAGMLVESVPYNHASDDIIRSISTKAPWHTSGQHAHYGPQIGIDDSDLWLAFLTEASQRQASEISQDSSVTSPERQQTAEPSLLMNEISSRMILAETIENLETMETLSKANLREQYESIHRRNPGLFWDTVSTDDPDAAFIKVRRITKEIVKQQKSLKPMFDIDFTNEIDHSTVEQKHATIRKQIAPQQLFY